MTNRPSKRKRIAAAALALMCLSGCTSTEEKVKALNEFAENCRRNGGTAITKASTNNISFLVPSYLDVTCSLPPSSEAGAKK